MLPFLALSSATSPGPGIERDLEKVFSRHTLIASMTGASGDSCAVLLEGSHDGATWLTLGSMSMSSPNSLRGVVSSISPHLIRYVRGNLQAGSISGSPIVTATIASGE
jgi:hypothetical protein